MKKIVILLFLFVSTISYSQVSTAKRLLLSGGFDLVYVNESNTLSQITNNIMGVHFKPDGSKMYVSENNGNTFQYSLSKNWDVTTATYDNVMHNADEAMQNITSEISEDGLNLYLIDNTGGKIYQYVLGSAWDLSTASTVANYSKSITLAYYAMQITPGGAYVIISKFGPSYPTYKYSLATPYNISTLNLTPVDSYGFGDCYFAFSETGNYAYILYNIGNSMYQYLSDQYNPSSVNSRESDTVDNSCGQTHFSVQNGYLYMCDITNKKIIQYLINK